MKLSKAVLAATGVALATALSFSAPGPVAQAAPVQPAAIGQTVTLTSEYWTPRTADTTSRYCSTQVNSNVSLSGSQVKLTVRKVTKGSTYNAIIAKAKKNPKLKGKKTAKKACPYGAYTSGMVGTAAKGFTMQYGTLEASIKFPVSQGMHAGVWLKSTTTNAEIDMIEGFGHGYGLTSTVWSPNGAKYDAWVLPSAAKKRSWWSKFHTVKVVWGSDGRYQFFLDGVKSRPDLVNTMNNGQSYEVVVSNLSSDWELKLMKKPTKKRGTGVKKGKVPSSLVVAWVKATPSA